MDFSVGKLEINLILDLSTSILVDKTIWSNTILFVTENDIFFSNLAQDSSLHTYSRPFPSLLNNNQMNH
jgi:hypothetical protein